LLVSAWLPNFIMNSTKQFPNRAALFRFVGAAIVFTALLSVYSQPSERPLTSFWVTDGPVYSLAVTNGVTYLAGQFNYVGPNGGSAGLLDLATGQGVHGFPVVQGTVYAAAPDGNGGWYIGGSFTNVGGTIRTNIAHVLADNSVDADWRPHANNTVLTLAISGGTVYAGGAFTRIGGQTRNRIAALDPVSGQATTWNPNAGGTVNTIVPANGLLYVGGAFTTIGGGSRGRLAALDPSAGTNTAWNPNAANGAVMALALDGDTIYVGGTFTTISSQPRNRIAAVSAATGEASTWDPLLQPASTAAGVSNIIVTADAVYFAGNFADAGGVPRSNLAAVDKVTAVATSWNPSANTNVNSMVLVNDTLFIGGPFTTVGGATRRRLAALSLTNGMAQPWNGVLSGLIPGSVFFAQVLKLSGDRLFVGGSFASIGGVERNNIAAIDNATGQATSWNPNANARVSALALGAGAIYAGGVFTNVGGALRNRLAALSPATGLATDWDPDVRGRADVEVLTLVPFANQLLVGGLNTTTVGGAPRTNLFSVNVTDGAPTPWNPPAYRSATVGSVNDIIVRSNLVYVGGDFSFIGSPSIARSNLAAISLIGAGAIEDWNPAARGAVVSGETTGRGVVNSLAASGDLIFVGGTFTNVGGVLRNRAGAVDAATGAGAGWNPNASTGTSPKINVMTLGNGALYVGGQFQAIGGSFRTNIAALNLGNGQVLEWNPNCNGQVRTLVRADSTIFVGGAFTAVGGQRQTHFAAFAAEPIILADTVAIVNNQFSFQLQTGDSAQVVIERSADLSAWTAISTNPGGVMLQFTDPQPVGQDNRFYQAYTLP
jgi:hypothetical protein